MEKLTYATQHMPETFRMAFAHMAMDTPAPTEPNLDGLTMFWALFVGAAGGQQVYGQRIFMKMVKDLERICDDVGMPEEELDNWLWEAERAIGRTPLQ